MRKISPASEPPKTVIEEPATEEMTPSTEAGPSRSGNTPPEDKPADADKEAEIPEEKQWHSQSRSTSSGKSSKKDGSSQTDRKRGHGNHHHHHNHHHHRHANGGSSEANPSGRRGPQTGADFEREIQKLLDEQSLRQEEEKSSPRQAAELGVESLKRHQEATGGNTSMLGRYVELAMDVARETPPVAQVSATPHSVNGELRSHQVGLAAIQELARRQQEELGLGAGPDLALEATPPSPAPQSSAVALSGTDPDDSESTSTVTGQRLSAGLISPTRYPLFQLNAASAHVMQGLTWHGEFLAWSAVEVVGCNLLVQRVLY